MKRARRLVRSVCSLACVAAPLFAGGCTKKLTPEQCNALLGRSIGMLAYPKGGEPKNELGLYGGIPGLDVDRIRKEAQGPTKAALEAYDKACLGSDDQAAFLCARHANDATQLWACGGMVAEAKKAAVLAKDLVPRKYDANECSAYAQHAVAVKAISVDDVGKTVQDCDAWLAIGRYDCRMAAKDAQAWKNCP